ncbi:hypothetical protein ACI8AK_10835 [Geodermatophilus sp. SYSU D00867]
MFEDQTVELLPERTTMQAFFSQNGNLAIAVALNVGNVNVGVLGDANQLNAAFAAAAAGSNFG